MGEWTVSEQSSGLSLQNFLKSKFPDSSAKSIKRAIDAGACQLNGRIEKFSSRLVGRGDAVKFDFAENEKLSKEKKHHILFVDSDLLAIDKPAGITSDNLKLHKSLHDEFGFVKLLHRLDKETSGVLLFARNEEFAVQIEQLFKQRNIEKTYLAIVDGKLCENSGLIDNYLGKLKVYEGQTLMGEVPKGEGALRAVTYYEVKKSNKIASLLCCKPKTGRMHQIRVHLSGLGFPILGDYQYGKKFKCKYRPERVLLHASEISLIHPKSLKKIVIKAEIPQDFERALEEIIGNE